MKNLFILILLALVCIGASVTTTKMLIQPARPIKTAVIVQYSGAAAQREIIRYVKQGYIVGKTFGLGDSNQGFTIVAIMELY